MKFLDLTGVQSLWNAIKAETAKSKTTVEGEATHATNAYIDVTGSEVTGSGADGHVNYVVTLHNAASTTDVATAKSEVIGDATASGNTLGKIEDRVETLETSTNVTVEKLQTAESGYFASYVVKQNNAQVGATINIPKDFLVKSGSVRAATAEDVANDSTLTVGEKLLDFVVNTIEGDGTASHIIIPVSDLVDIYTGSNGVAVDGSNNITAVVDSAANGNEFLSVSATGLKVSGVSSAIATAKSEVIGASGDAASANTVYGAKAYADEKLADATADLEVTASGDTYVSASQDANDNKHINVAATASTIASLGLADSALQGVDTTQQGTNVKVTLGTSGKNVTVAVDETALGTALNGKVDKVEGSSLMTQAEHDKLAAIEASADVNVIEVVKVNGTALSVNSADKSVDIDLTGKADKVASATSGNFAGLDANGNLTDSGSKAADFATAAQGTKANTAIQGVTGETAITGGESSYVAVTTSEDASHEVILASSVKVQAVASASSSAQGLAEASDVKSYVDGQLAAGNITIASNTETATGTPASAGTMVVNSVTTQNGSVTAVGSVEVETAGAAAAAESRLRGATDAAGYVANDTLAALRNDINSITGGSGSIATQIANAINDLDSDVNASTATTNHITATPTNTTTSASATPTVDVITSFTITNGVVTAATAETIGAIPASELQAIFSGE